MIDLKNNLTKRLYLQAMRLLSRRDYSIHKIREKLTKKSDDDILIDQLIQYLVDKKYLREDLYIEARVKGLMRKGYSPTHIKYKLRMEKCSIEISEIFNIFEEANSSINEQLLKLIDKKSCRGTRISEQKDKERIIRFLMTKGHSYEDIKNSIIHYKEGLNI